MIIYIIFVSSSFTFYFPAKLQTMLLLYWGPVLSPAPDPAVLENRGSLGQQLDLYIADSRVFHHVENPIGLFNPTHTHTHTHRYQSYHNFEPQNLENVSCSSAFSTSQFHAAPKLSGMASALSSSRTTCHGYSPGTQGMAVTAMTAVTAVAGDCKHLQTL